MQGYFADESTSDWASPHLRELLQILAHQAGAERIFVLAHSMGSRVIAGALASMVGTSETTKLQHVILAAPDVDRDVFESRDALLLRQKAKWLTLYASSRDKALALSRKLHSYGRAGFSEPPLVVLDSMDTIDASEVDTDLIGHGYFSENKTVIDDLFMMIRYEALAHDRNLTKRSQGTRYFYAFR
jgi:esterase/lipase superfamily enzyme